MVNNINLTNTAEDYKGTNTIPIKRPRDNTTISIVVWKNLKQPLNHSKIKHSRKGWT